MREPWYVLGSPVLQFVVSSLQPTCAPDWQLPLRRYITVSKRVSVPQVAMVAVPERVGVHWKTFSGELLLVLQVPASVLVPLVVPVKVPPAAGITVAALQASAPGVTVTVGVGVAVRVGVRVAVALVGVAVRVGVGVRVAVRVGVTLVGVGVRVGVAVGVDVGSGVGVTVRVGPATVAVGVLVGPAGGSTTNV